MVNNIVYYLPLSIIFLQPFLDGKIELSLFLSSIILILYLARTKKIVLDKIFIFIMFYLMIHTIINIIFNNTTFILFIKQIIGISIYYLLYKNVYLNFKAVDLIKMYINAVIIISIIGIIQQISFILRIDQFYNLSWLIKGQLIGTTNLGLIRVTSIMTEPSQLAMVMTPAVYIAISNLYNKEYLMIKKYQSLLIIICYILTFSSIAYIGLGIIFIFNINNIKSKIKKIFIIFTLIGLICTLYNTVDDFKLRVDDTVDVILGQDIESSNLSTYALISNLQVALKSFKNTGTIGSGIGSHQLNYEKYIYDIVSYIPIKLNVEDANSLFSRLLSELGILGIIFFAIFLVKNTVVKKYKDRNIISCAIIVFMLLKLLRSGHYFNDGIFFFAVIFIKNKYEFENQLNRNMLDKSNITNEKIE